jgi:uncharacterized NAD(P)/FAD-binding protein YdhS
MDKQLWTADELKDLILYAKEMQQVNDDLRAQNMALLAKLQNEESKVKWCRNQIKIMMTKQN